MSQPFLTKVLKKGDLQKIKVTPIDRNSGNPLGAFLNKSLQLGKSSKYYKYVT